MGRCVVDFRKIPLLLSASQCIQVFETAKPWSFCQRLRHYTCVIFLDGYSVEGPQEAFMCLHFTWYDDCTNFTRVNLLQSVGCAMVKLDMSRYKRVEELNQQHLRFVFFGFICERLEVDSLCFFTVVSISEFASKEELEYAYLLVAPPMCSSVLRLHLSAAQNARPVNIRMDYHVQQQGHLLPLIRIQIH
jgi:hypothetical protein